MTAINVIQSLVSIYAYVLYVNMMHITSIWNTYWRWRWWCFSLCALNELQWRLIDMPSLKNVIFMHMQIFFLNFSRSYFFFLLISQSSTASMCEKFMHFYVQSIYAAAVSTISNIWLTEWLTDWLNIFCGCLNIPQMNRRLHSILCRTKKKENLWNVCGSRYKEKKWKEWYAESVCYT